MIKRGVSFFSFDEKVDYRKAMQWSAAAGYEGVELAITEGGSLTPHMTNAQLDMLKAQAAELGLTICSIGANNVWEHNLASPQRVERTLAQDNIRRQMEYAACLGADTVLVVPGWVGTPFTEGTVRYDQAYENAEQALYELSAEAKACGIVIAIEEVWNKFLLSPLEMRRFLDEINSPFVKAYFDIGNIIYIGYPEHWIPILGDRIHRLQFCDCRFGQGGLDMFVDLLEGDVNYPQVMQEIRKLRYDGWAVVELFPPYKHHQDYAITQAKSALDYILNIEETV